MSKKGSDHSWQGSRNAALFRSIWRVPRKNHVRINRACILAVLIAAFDSFFVPAWGQGKSVYFSEHDLTTAGHTPEEGFRLRSADGNYVLRFQLRTGIKEDFAWTSGAWDPSGIFSYLRPILRGNLYKKWIRFFTAMEWSESTPFLLDGFVDIQPLEHFGFIFGQQGTPVSRHNAFGPHQIFFPDYAGVSTYFWSGRERGLTLYGATPREIFEYDAGIYDGSPIILPLRRPNNYVVEARATVNPLGPVNATEYPFTPEGCPLPFNVSFTFQGYFGRIATTLESYNFSNGVLTPIQTEQAERTGTLGADLWFQKGPIIAFGEYYWRRLTPLDSNGGTFNSTGAWGQILWNIYKNRLGLGSRLGWIDPNRNLSGDQSWEIEGQTAWFIHSTDLVLKLRYAWLLQNSPGDEKLDGFILPYIVGTTHVVTLQFALSF